MDIRRALAVVALAAAVAPALATVRWDEAVDGDLSNNGLAPTVVTVAAGSNVVLGSTGNSGQGVDRDYFTFTVPAGSVLSSITLLSNTSVAGSVSFIALQEGPQVTVSPSGAGSWALLGFAHYGVDQVGQNLLDTMVEPGTRLTAGPYSAWVQETGARVSYGFDFVISAVPEPGTGALLLAGLLGLGALRRR